MPLAAQAKLLDMLRVFGQDDDGCALQQRRHFNVATQCDLSHGNGQHAVQIVAIAFERIMFALANFDVPNLLTGSSQVGATLPAGTVAK